jgi:hypothetical protein
MRMIPTEAETSRAIMDYLAAERIFALRLNTAAMKVEGRFFRSHSAGKGCADILVIMGVKVSLVDPLSTECYQLQRALWIEVKSPTGKQSPEQVSFQKDVEARGHLYILARSMEDVITVVTGLRK